MLYCNFHVIWTETYFPASIWEDFVIFWEVSLILVIAKYQNEVLHVVEMMYLVEYKFKNSGIIIYHVSVYRSSCYSLHNDDMYICIKPLCT